MQERERRKLSDILSLLKMDFKFEQPQTPIVLIKRCRIILNEMVPLQTEFLNKEEDSQLVELKNDILSLATFINNEKEGLHKIISAANTLLISRRLASLDSIKDIEFRLQRSSIQLRGQRTRRIRDGLATSADFDFELDFENMEVDELKEEKWRDYIDGNISNPPPSSLLSHSSVQQLLTRPEHFKRKSSSPTPTIQSQIILMSSPKPNESLWEGSDFKLTLLKSLQKKLLMKLIFNTLKHHCQVCLASRQAVNTCTRVRTKKIIHMVFYSIFLEALSNSYISWKAEQKAYLLWYRFTLSSSINTLKYKRIFRLASLERFGTAVLHKDRLCYKYGLELLSWNGMRGSRIRVAKEWASNHRNRQICGRAILSWILTFTKRNLLKIALETKLSTIESLSSSLMPSDMFNGSDAEVEWKRVRNTCEKVIIRQQQESFALLRHNLANSFTLGRTHHSYLHPNQSSNKVNSPMSSYSLSSGSSLNQSIPRSQPFSPFPSSSPSKEGELFSPPRLFHKHDSKNLNSTSSLSKTFNRPSGSTSTTPHSFSRQYNHTTSNLPVVSSLIEKSGELHNHLQRAINARNISPASSVKKRIEESTPGDSYRRVINNSRSRIRINTSSRSFSPSSSSGSGNSSDVDDEIKIEFENDDYDQDNQLLLSHTHPSFASAYHSQSTFSPQITHSMLSTTSLHSRSLLDAAIEMSVHSSRLQPSYSNSISGALNESYYRASRLVRKARWCLLRFKKNALVSIAFREIKRKHWKWTLFSKMKRWKRCISKISRQYQLCDDHWANNCKRKMLSKWLQKSVNRFRPMILSIIRLRYKHMITRTLLSWYHYHKEIIGTEIANRFATQNYLKNSMEILKEQTKKARGLKRLRKRVVRRVVFPLLQWWKERTKKLSLLRRVFSIYNVSWELKIAEIRSTTYSLLVSIVGSWRQMTIENIQMRKDNENLSKSLIFRGASLKAKAFFAWLEGALYEKKIRIATESKIRNISIMLMRSSFISLREEANEWKFQMEKSVIIHRHSVLRKIMYAWKIYILLTQNELEEECIKYSYQKVLYILRDIALTNRASNFLEPSCQTRTLKRGFGNWLRVSRTRDAVRAGVQACVSALIRSRLRRAMKDWPGRAQWAIAEQMNRKLRSRGRGRSRLVEIMPEKQIIENYTHPNVQSFLKPAVVRMTLMQRISAMVSAFGSRGKPGQGGIYTHPHTLTELIELVSVVFVQWAKAAFGLRLRRGRARKVRAVREKSMLAVALRHWISRASGTSHRTMTWIQKRDIVLSHHSSTRFSQIRPESRQPFGISGI